MKQMIVSADTEVFHRFNNYKQSLTTVANLRYCKPMNQPIQNSTSKIWCYTLIGLALFLGGTSMPAFAVFLFAGSPTIIDLNLGKPAAFYLDAFLCGLFFVQHSCMVRSPFQRWIHSWIPKAYTAAVYAVASGAGLWLVVLMWQSVMPPMFKMENHFRFLTRILFFLSIAGTIWGNLSLHSFDPMGVKAALRHLRKEKPQVMPFMIRGPYRWVRHPLYFFSLVMIWSCPDWTMDRLMFNLLWTAWLVLGTLLEERDLLTAHGEMYRRYQEDVPMLIPIYRRKNRFNCFF